MVAPKVKIRIGPPFGSQTSVSPFRANDKDRTVLKSDVIVAWVTPRDTSQRIIRSSAPPDANRFESAENVRATTLFKCPFRVVDTLQLAVSQSLTVPSSWPVASNLPSGESARAAMPLFD